MGCGGGTDLFREREAKIAKSLRRRWFGDNIHRAATECLEGSCTRSLALRADDERWDGIQKHELTQKGQAVHARHLDIESDDVGAQSKNLVACNVGVGRGSDDLHVRFRGDGFSQDLANDG